jgi:hypothetical protein
MDVQDILKSLGIDLTSPEAKQGAIEALQAILASRQPAGNLGGMDGAGSGDETETVEMDPNLILPSQKNMPMNQDDLDIEIEDEDDVLSQIKQNNSESSQETNDSDYGSDSETSPEEGAEETAESEATGEGEETDNSSSDPNEEAADTETAGSDENGNTSSEADTSTESENTSEDDSEEADTTADSDGESGEETTDEEAADTFDDEFDEDEFDEDESDLLDTELQKVYDDTDKQSKYDARKIKRERTLQAAKKALANAQARNVSASLIKELESAIAELEKLQEAKAKTLKSLSDDEFNLIINRVFDAIDAVGDKDLTYTTDEERELRAKEINDDITSADTQRELSAEDAAQIRAETQEVKAREKDKAQYKQRSASSFKGFQEFLNSLYRAIALQVQTNEINNDTWSAINRRYSGTGVLKQGQRKEDLPDKKIPVIDFYFDCSASWTMHDINIGKKAVEALADMEDKGQIKINIYYFSSDVFNDYQSARAMGSTDGWNSIVKNVIKTQATNVIIMTDEDMDRWWEPLDQPPLSYTVPGYVWYLWRDGENAPRLPRDLKGRGGTQQFSFSASDL